MSTIKARGRKARIPGQGHGVNAGQLPEKHWYHDRRQGGRLLGAVFHSMKLSSSGCNAPVMSTPPTKSQANKAGKVLRSWAPGDPVPEAGHRAALEVLWAHRAAHQYPLQKATMGLRSMVKSEDCGVEVSQRLKRVPTILDKLRRDPTMQLANMQDIAGCRAVLASVNEVRRV